MDYLRREIDDFLLDWKKNINKKPLIVKGARQIGKTESILHFAKGNYKNVVYINFALEKKFKVITQNSYKADDIIKNISLIDSSINFIPKKTLIFFDEIQDFPDIATSLKSFNENKNYDVICSGSLLGINYKQIESNSVGNKENYEMQSMNFKEFLFAKNYKQDVVEDLFNHLLNLEPFSQTELNVFNSLFLDYIILGGMPQVVLQYIKNGTFENTLENQRQIILDYKEDIRKYAQGVDQTRILNVFNSIPFQLAKENKKFQISKIQKGARFKDYWGCVEWLCDSGITNMCKCLLFPELPLKGNVDNNKFKLYFKDTGLFVSMLDDEAQEDLRANKNLDVYKGALYENIVAETLSKAGCDLFYYKKENSTLEQDFFMRTKDFLVPVEVKATNSKAKSLETLIKSDSYPDIKFGIKLCKANIGFNNGIYTFPYFCSFLIKRWLSSYKNFKV